MGRFWEEVNTASSRIPGENVRLELGAGDRTETKNIVRTSLMGAVYIRPKPLCRQLHHVHFKPIFFVINDHGGHLQFSDRVENC